MFSIYIIINTLIALFLLFDRYIAGTVRVSHILISFVIVFIGLLLVIVDVLCEHCGKKVRIWIARHPPICWWISLGRWLEKSRIGRIVVIDKPGR